jgi:hypothetical protein
MQKMPGNPRAFPTGTSSAEKLPDVQRLLFEAPLPALIVLGAIAAIAVWRALAGSGRPAWIAAGVAAALGIATFVAARTVTTPGEHAASVVRALVAHAEAAETDAAVALFSPSAVFNYGMRENAGFAIGEIESALRSLEGKHRIVQNRIRRLEFATIDERTGEVELSCSTETTLSMGAIPTDWIMRVRREGDRWRIDRITFERLYGRPPTVGIWR